LVWPTDVAHDATHFMDELFASHVGRVGAFIRDGCIQGVGCVSIRDCKWRLSCIFGIHRVLMPWIFIALGHIRTVWTLRPEAVPNGIVDSVVADLMCSSGTSFTLAHFILLLQDVFYVRDLPEALTLKRGPKLIVRDGLHEALDMLLALNRES
jgi:hypothetical protein